MTEDINFEKLFIEKPIEALDLILRGALSGIYLVKKNTKVPDWLDYSNLLIDKFAIHSASYFHLSKGIIEHKKSGETVKMNGYDLFTVNTTIRAIIETYITFNHIFIEPKSIDEKEFRFLLWKLDGLFQKENYDIENSDYKDVKVMKKKNKEDIDETINKIQKNKFHNTLSDIQIRKILNLNKKRVNWRFLIIEDEVKILKISELVKHVCKIRAFTNTYKYSSIHTHSNFPAIEEFKTIRGKKVFEKSSDIMTIVAIYTTCLIISDICEIDSKAKRTLYLYPESIKNFIIGMSNTIKNNL